MKAAFQVQNSPELLHARHREEALGTERFPNMLQASAAPEAEAPPSEARDTASGPCAPPAGFTPPRGT